MIQIQSVIPSIDITHRFLYFLIYAFVGWTSEEIYCSILQRKLVMRGMLYGPICPIYGFGGILIMYILYPLRDTWVWLFLASMVVTSALEYFSSWLLERLFHAQWWDYSDVPLNLNGRICLLNSVLFGLGGLAMWHLMQPFFEQVVYWQPAQPYINLIAGGLALLLSADVLLTIRRLVDFNTSMAKLRLVMEQARERFEKEAWFKPQSASSVIASIRERSKTERHRFTRHELELLDMDAKRRRNIDWLLERFPSLKSREYPTLVEHFKKEAADRRNARASSAEPKSGAE